MPRYTYRCQECGHCEVETRTVDDRDNPQPCRACYSGRQVRAWHEDAAVDGVPSVRFIGAGVSSKGFDHIPVNDSLHKRTTATRKSTRNG
ncbi:MAG: FmdB family zinc ribbon protein [Planctomycetota bacterium]|jgi:putative FmdB family regulatory protein